MRELKRSIRTPTTSFLRRQEPSLSSRTPPTKQRGPCLRVVFREVSDDFGGGLIVEASQSGSIIVVDECEDEGVSLVLGGEAVFSGISAVGWFGGDGFAEAAIEALDHAVGLGMVGFGQPVADALALAEAIEGVAPGAGLACGVLGSAEAVGELGAVVGEHGVDGMAEGVEETGEGGGDGIGTALGQDLDMDEAGGTLDDDEDIGGVAFKTGEMLEVGMDVAERFGGEMAGGVCGDLVWRKAAGDAMAAPEAIERRARDVGAQTAVHDFERIVDGQAEPAAQFKSDLLFFEAEAGDDPMGDRTMVGGVGSRLPATYCCPVDAELSRQRGHALIARLDVSPLARRGDGIAVQLHQHDWRLLSQDRPRSTPLPSRQPLGTQHLRRDDSKWGTAYARPPSGSLYSGITNCLSNRQIPSNSTCHLPTVRPQRIPYRAL